MRRGPERVGLSSEAEKADVAVTRPGREVTVSLAGRDRGVPEPPLHHTQGSAARHEDARERVPQPVPGNAAQPGPPLRTPEQLTELPGTQMWSSQDSVDTQSPRFLGRFELLRAHAAEMTVAAGSIVEAIDVVGDVLRR
jgi:hypothetical protein